ncbi:DUF2155 domain-containing protein [Yoonia litorea]|uniref:DUF2155 domain-containing protein n=1 Tax=Yoonia litorea TaxID=1123755 RepID=A0A1I6LMH2_9RHOB|nr:DUF2155 domain-containing protein [Yoonia litorea]SFS04684.1 hypothetical protein SAMN05444714_0701 [Yoonia litorea]
MLRFSAMSIALMLFVAPAQAQEITITPLDDAPLIEIPLDQLDLGDDFNPNIGDDGQLDNLLEELTASPVEAPRAEVSSGPSGTLRVLDKLTGEVNDVTLMAGQTRRLGFLSVTVAECRYPVENPSGDAFIFVRASDLREDVDLFAGWMIASAPALNALDHPRYDIWALRCTTS